MVSKTTRLNDYICPAKSTWMPHSPERRGTKDMEIAEGGRLWIAVLHQRRKFTLSL